ncbi:Ig-like domain-containing protein [Mycolicibacterium lacusdiani]|uniref:Ig-like domain-containing protein n=1 Tax=Mycolicibacterium lacusdiani TaxID=2895283 RepID=UPI001F36AB1C|nr:Ig-like domain-containing protein [Mycolicibacterium lacusdiani]
MQTAAPTALAAARVTSETAPAAITTQPAGPIETLLIAPTRIVVGLLGLLVGPIAASPLSPAAPGPVFELLVAFYRRIDNFLFNATPTANPRQLGQTTPEGIVTGTLGASDANGDPLRYQVITQPTSGTVVVAPDGTYVYTPKPGTAQAGITDAFTVTIDDGAGFHLFGFLSQRSITVTVPVNVSGTNRAPEFGTRPVVTAIDPTTGAVTVTFGVSDPDGDPLRYSATATDPTATVAVSGTQVTYVPTDAARHAAALHPTTDTITVVVTDRLGASTTATVSVPVLGRNAVPATTGVTVDTTDPATGRITGSLNVSDADRDTLTFTPTTVTTTKGTFTVDATGRFTYQPTDAARHAAAKLGATSATYDSADFAVSDGYGGSILVSVTVGIAPQNEAPVLASNPTVSAPAANGTVTGTVRFTDSDDDPLGLSATTDPRGQLVFAADGSFTFTPTEAATLAAGAVAATAADRQVIYTVTATDGYGGVSTVNVTVPIRPQPVAPVAGVGFESAREDTVFSGTLVGLATDANGDPLTFEVSENPTHGTLVLAPNGTYTYTPGRDYAGIDVFSFTASDGVQRSERGYVTIGVNPINDAPVAGTVSLTTSQNTPASGTLTATDVDSTTLTYSGGGKTTKGTVVINGDGTFRYTPDQNVSGSDTFTFTVSDGALTSTGTVNVTVEPVNQAPTGSVEVRVTDPDTGELRIIVTGTDPDGGTVTITEPSDPTRYDLVFVSRAPSNGVTVSQYVFRPSDAARTAAAATPGDDVQTLSFTISDGALTSTVSVDVPVAPAAGAVLVDPETPVSLNLQPGTTGASAGTINATKQGVSFTVTGQPRFGTFAIGADGAFTYTPDPVRRVAAAGTASTADDVDTVVVRVSDGVTSQTVTINPSVSPTTVAAVYQLPAGTTAQGSAVVDANGVGYLRVRTADGNYAIVVTSPGGAALRVIALAGAPVDGVYVDGRTALQYSRATDGTVSATVIRTGGATTTALPGSPTDQFVDGRTGTVYVVSESITGVHSVTLLPTAGASSTVSLPGTPSDLIARADGSYYTVTTSPTGEHTVVVIRADATTVSAPLPGTPVTEGIPGKAGLLTFLTRATDGTSAVTVLRLDGTVSTTVVPGTAITLPFPNDRGLLTVRSVRQNGNSLTDYATTISDNGVVEVRQGDTRNLGGTLVGTIGHLGEDASTRYYTVLLPKALINDPDRYELVVQNGDFTRRFALPGSPLDERDRFRPTFTNIDTHTIYQLTTLTPDRGDPVDYVAVIDTRLLTSRTVALPGGISIDPAIDPVSGTAFIVSNDLTNQWITVLNIDDEPTTIPVNGTFPRTEFFVSGGVGRVVTNAAGTYALLTVDATGRVQTTPLGGTPVGGYVVDPVSGKVVQAVASNGQASLVIISADGSSTTAALPNTLTDGPFVSGQDGVIRAVVKAPGTNGAYSIATIRPDGTVVTAALGTTMNPTVLELENSFIVRVRAGSTSGVVVVRDDGSTVGISIPGVPINDFNVDERGRTYFTSVSGTNTTVTIVAPDGTSTVRTVPGRASTAVTFGPSGAFQLTDAGLFALAEPTDTGLL